MKRSPQSTHRLLPAKTGGAAGDGVNGGAILNSGSLTLIDSAVTNSRAGDGGIGGFGAGAIANGGPGGAGGAGGSGGGIYNTGTLTLQGATIAGNSTGTGAPAVQAVPAPAPGGPAVLAARAAKEAGSQTQVALSRWWKALSRATTPATGGHGGDAGSGPAGGDGGNGGSASGGGGIVSTGGTLTIANSTFASNAAGAGSVGGNGGGSTSGGSAGANGNPGGGGNGGGIDVLGAGSSSVQSATVAGNTAADVGGGIFSDDAATTLQNSLLASNSGGNCSGAIVDSGHNLSFAGAGCPATFATGDPNLGPLENNGGSAQTISLGSGSTAIDKVPSSGAGCPAKDERGVHRPNGSGCDIGAYEVAPPTATTSRAKSASSSSAVLTASVTPNAGVATVQFQFDTSKKYTSKTAVQRIGGVVAVTVTRKVTGLRPATTYHYRVVVTAPDGTAQAQDRSFKTSRGPTLTGLSVKPVVFRVSGPGTTISYFDTEAATTTFTVLRCTKPIAHGARCARFVKAATFTYRDHAGRNKLPLRARIGRRTLSPGTYRLDARPRAGRKTGNTVSARFQVSA